MKDNKSYWSKFFVGFGAAVVVSGLYLIFRQDYISGVSGSLVGALLIYLNVQQSKV